MKGIDAKVWGINHINSIFGIEVEFYYIKILCL